MTPLEKAYLHAVELHSVSGIKECFQEGLDPRKRVDGRLPIEWLTEMYTRSDRFSECVRVLLEHDARIDNPALEAVLTNDSEMLSGLISSQPDVLNAKVNLVCAFTPLLGATLLHVAVEYGCLDAALCLMNRGANTNAPAADGHTPLFHTVNTNRNLGRQSMELLIEAGASIDILIPQLIWGQGFEWETTLFDLTPISYTLCGLLPQMHRDEIDIYSNIKFLLESSGRPVPDIRNLPNNYLRGKQQVP